LRAKLVTLVTAGSVGGGLVGILEASLGYAVWPLAVGLTCWLILLFWLGQIWVCRPFERLLHKLDRIRNISRPGGLDSLLLRRRDEVGKLAHAVHTIASEALRDQREVRLLRRTLDHKVASATRTATQQLRQMAMRDPLTNLGNRHFLDQNLEALVESILQSEADLVCVMLDMDNFKAVNDTLGHATGDDLLIFLGSLVRANARRNDVVVRLGGDEFVILMPECSSARVSKMTTAIQSLFRQHARVTLGGELTVSVSMGVASLKRDKIRTGEALLARADERLYEAKRNGKARTVGIE